MLFISSMISDDCLQSELEHIYLSYRNMMYWIAFKILQNARDAEDVVQEVFVVIIEKNDKLDFSDERKVKSLLEMLTERKAIDLYRKKSRRKEQFSEDIDLDHEAYVEEDKIVNEITLAEAIASLQSNYREALILKYFNGFSEAETAELLSMTEANVHKIIQRAKKKLTKLLADNEVE